MERGDLWERRRRQAEVAMWDELKAQVVEIKIYSCIGDGVMMCVFVLITFMYLYFIYFCVCDVFMCGLVLLTQ
jgi:hypothetical protein